MFNTLYLLNYNNYYNRMIKEERTLADYREYEVDRVVSTNFNPADGVNTIIENVLLSDDAHPDYCIVSDSTGVDIVSRWFVIEANRKRGGQWDLVLHRDVITDYMEIIRMAPCFIEKATLDPSNPLILNQEDFQVNQIKTSETLLKDEYGCAWLVGYLNPEQSITNINISNVRQIENTELIGEPTAWEYYRYSSFVNEPEEYLNSYKSITLGFAFLDVSSNREHLLVEWDANTNTYQARKVTQNMVTDFAGEGGYIKYNSTTSQLEDFMAQVKSTAETNDRLKFAIIPDYEGNITELQGKILQDAQQNYYSVYLNEVSLPFETTGQISTGSSLAVALTNLATTVTGLAPDSNISLSFTGGGLATYTIKLTEIEDDYSASFDLNVAKNFTDDIYRIIAIPYPDEGKYFQINGAVAEDGETNLNTIRMTRETAKNIAASIVKKGGGTGANTLVYDFQLLPYCPIRNQYEWATADGGERWYINLDGNTPLAGHYTPVGELGVVFEVKSPSFTFNIQHSIIVTDPKVENQCDKYRLCSPNWASVFEFNAAKNGGVNYFNVDCHYKPYTPYIHINPNFGLLYGADFNDARGLILAGDFSIGSSSDAFINYELSNKNYQLIFDRQIENLEIQHKYQKIGEGVQAVSGTITGAVSGVAIGAMMGGGVGAAIGGIAGGVTSAAGGITDVAINNKLRREAIDYTKDQFGYNLENIQATPSTLSKVTAFNNNNKIYPVLEYYTCTTIEKAAFRRKLKYNGMSVGIIDKLFWYIHDEPTYIKAQIIRLEQLDEDFHVANAIAKELNMGVFI